MNSTDSFNNAFLPLNIAPTWERNMEGKCMVNSCGKADSKCCGLCGLVRNWVVLIVGTRVWGLGFLGGTLGIYKKKNETHKAGRQLDFKYFARATLLSAACSLSLSLVILQGSKNLKLSM